MSKSHETYAKQMLDRLVAIDHATVEAYYEMGAILAAIEEGKLYDLLGYSSLKALIDEELSYTDSTAYRYKNTYKHFKRLKYTKNEALKLLREVGFTHMSDILPSMKENIGIRAIKNRIKKLDIHQINFQLNDDQ